VCGGGGNCPAARKILMRRKWRKGCRGLREGIFGGTCQRWRRRSVPGRDRNSRLGVDLLAWNGEPDISKIAVVNQGRIRSVDQPSCGPSWCDCDPLAGGVVRVPGIEQWRGGFGRIREVIDPFNIDCDRSKFLCRSRFLWVPGKSVQVGLSKRMEGIAVGWIGPGKRPLIVRYVGFPNRVGSQNVNS
jgi:hypothetical protein